MHNQNPLIIAFPRAFFNATVMSNLPLLMRRYLIYRTCHQNTITNILDYNKLNSIHIQQSPNILFPNYQKKYTPKAICHTIHVTKNSSFSSQNPQAISPFEVFHISNSGLSPHNSFTIRTKWFFMVHTARLAYCSHFVNSWSQFYALNHSSKNKSPAIFTLYRYNIIDNRQMRAYHSPRMINSHQNQFDPSMMMSPTNFVVSSS